MCYTIYEISQSVLVQNAIIYLKKGCDYDEYDSL